MHCYTDIYKQKDDFISFNNLQYYCANPGIIHTHPMEGHWKFLGGGGLKCQNVRSKE